MPMCSSSTASVTTMLSLRVIAFLSASLVSLVPGKKYLVETDDSDAQIDHDLVETKSKSKNRFVGFGHGGSNQAASLIQEFGSDYSDHGIVNGGSGNQAATVIQDKGIAYGGSNQAANVIQNRARASVPRLPSLDVFKNPKQQNNIRSKNRLGLIDFLYQRSPTTLSEKPFE